MTTTLTAPALTSFDAFANAIAILRGTANVSWMDRCVFSETTNKVHLRMRSLYAWPKPIILAPASR